MAASRRQPNSSVTTSSVLAARFAASFEQVAHRLTTLSRQTARGIPFFLVRVDIAGNVSKRFSSSRFPFANSGGTCPLWNIHATFTNPGRILTQVIELTDGSQWFSIARTVRRAITPWGAIEPRFAIGLGCEIKYARPARLRQAASISIVWRRRRSASIAGSATGRPARSAPRRRPCARCSSTNRCARLAVPVQGCEGCPPLGSARSSF